MKRPLEEADETLDHRRRKTVANTVGYVKPPAVNRIAILLDASNILGGARRLGGVPNYQSIVEEIARDREWLGTACVIARPDNRPIGGFIRMLARLGFRAAVWKPLMVCGVPKTNNDAQIAVEGMRLLACPDVGELCLATGDSDLRVLGEECRRVGKRLTVASFAGQCSAALSSLADRLLLLGREHVIARPRVARAG